MPAITGMQIGEALAEALRLPPSTTFIQLTVGMNEPVSVTVRYYIDKEDAERAVEVLASLHLYADTPMSEMCEEISCDGDVSHDPASSGSY